LNFEFLWSTPKPYAKSFAQKTPLGFHLTDSGSMQKPLVPSYKIENVRSESYF